MDEKLKFYEAEWKKERDARIALQQLTGTSEGQLGLLQQQVVRLQGEVEALRTAHSAAEAETEAMRAEAARLTQRCGMLQRQLENLRFEATEPAFWQDLAATPLAKALDDFERLPDVAAESFSGDAGEMALEAAQLVIDLEENYEEDKAERLRGLLIAQWVYARWLEVTAELGR